MPTVGGIPPTEERRKELKRNHGAWMALGGGDPELMYQRASDETARMEFWTGNSKKKKGEAKSQGSGKIRRIWRQPKNRKNGGQFAPKPDYEK